MQAKTEHVSESQLLEFAKSIKLTATSVLEGGHTFNRDGRGIEFQTSHPYQPGDELRFVDWKRYAATDRLFTNQYRLETKAGWRVWVDGSPSMTYEGKRSWANLWAGSLLFLAQTWGDPWSLNQKKSSGLDEAFRELLSASSEVSFSCLDDGVLTDRLVLLSDFFFDFESLEKSVRQFESSYHSVHLIQVMGQSEIEFAFDEVIEFQDLESKSKLVLDSKIVRPAYHAAFRRHQLQLKSLTSDRVSIMILRSEGESLVSQLDHFFGNL